MPELSDFQLRTVPGLWERYAAAPPRLSFQAQTRTEAEAWQAELRSTLTHLLGALPSEPCDLSPQLISRTEEPGFTRELVVMQVRPGDYMPCYVLVPPSAPPFTPVLALHGHGERAPERIVGLIESPADAEHIAARNSDFARHLVRRGFLVFAPVLRSFSARMETPPLLDLRPPAPRSTCQVDSLIALLAGQTLLGLRVGDVLRLLDYVATRPEARPAPIGAVGFSGGGTLLLYAAALDQRLAAAVISGAFSTFRASLMAVPHCACNFVPGVVQQAEMADIAGLIAPRPLLIELGEHDQNFPMAAARPAVEDLCAIYKVFGAADQVATDFFDGPHRWHGQLAYPWLARVL